LAQFRVTPVVAGTSRSRLFRPDKLSGDRPTTVAKLENGLTRIEFELHHDIEGRPLVVRRTSVRVGEDWQSVAGVGEGEVLFLLYAATCEAELKSMPRWRTPEYRVELDVAGKKIEAAGDTTDPFQPGTGARLRPVAARQTSPNTVTVEYELVGEKGLVKDDRATGTFTLAAASREVQLELVLEPARAGFYSAGIGGFRSWSAEEIECVQLPPLFQFQRLPERPEMVTSSLTPHPLALVQVKAGEADDSSMCFAVTGEPARLPFRWPDAQNMVYGFAIVDAGRRVQPCAFSPVLGAEGSKWPAGSKQSVAWRLLAMPGDWKSALEYYSQSIARVTDYRRPIHASLTEAALNMIDLMADEQASGWHPHLKGFYDIETPAMGKQAAPLAVIEAAVLARDESFWFRRALPTIEFLLRSKGPAVIRSGEVEGERAHHRPRVLTSQLHVPSQFFDTSLWEGLSSLTGGVNPWMREFALPGGEVYHARAYNASPRWSALLARYRMEPSQELLGASCKEADDFLASQFAARQTKPVDFGHFYNIHFYPYWWELLDLYELTGEKRYLAAAEEGAFHTLAGQWSHPPIPPGEALIHATGQEPTPMPVWWRDGVPFRLGWPRKPNDTPAHRVPAWQVSPIGLGLEQPSTYTAFPSAMNNILMSCWAPHLLRVHQHSGREIYRTYARNSILGRFANYPGYYLSGLTDLPQSPRYPYEGPDVSSIYYHHIPVHFGFTIDFLVAQAESRSGGRIRFPYAKQKNYAWFDFRTYGLGPGTIYGESGAVPWLRRNLVRLDTPLVDWLAARSADRFYLILMSQSDEPIRVRPELDAAAIGLVDGPVRVYESAALPPSPPVPAPQGKEGVVPLQVGVVSEVTVQPKGLTAISWPAECREAMPRVPPLEKGHVMTDLAGWGKLHAFRIRSPFGSDAVFVVLVSDPVDGATARLNAHIRSGEKQLTISEFPYEFSLDRVEMDEDVSIEFTISGAAGRPERSARLSLSGGRG
jgi:hypothetical protein